MQAAGCNYSGRRRLSSPGTRAVPPGLFNGTLNVPRSPGSIKLFVLPPTSETVVVPSVTLAAVGDAPRKANAESGMMMPKPESRSTPGASLSTAVLWRAVRICAFVSNGFELFRRAAMAPACGAAAEVPKNEIPKPPAPVTETPSAAVMSGFWREMPPRWMKHSGVKGVPFDMAAFYADHRKKMFPPGSRP